MRRCVLPWREYAVIGRCTEYPTRRKETKEKKSPFHWKGKVIYILRLFIFSINTESEEKEVTIMYYKKTRRLTVPKKEIPFCHSRYQRKFSKRHAKKIKCIYQTPPSWWLVFQRAVTGFSKRWRHHCFLFRFLVTFGTLVRPSTFFFCFTLDHLVLVLNRALEAELTSHHREKTASQYQKKTYNVC